MKTLALISIIFLTLFNANAQRVEVGLKAPDFKLYALDGSTTTLKDYENKVVVIKMWFKECAPCLQEMPRLNGLTKKFKSRKDVVFIAPSPNSKSTLQKFAKKVEFDYTIMSAAYEMLKDYNPLKRFPSHVIIDKKGVISYLFEGTSSTIEKTLEEEINKVLEI